MMNVEAESVFKPKLEKPESINLELDKSIPLPPVKEEENHEEDKPKNMSHQEALAFIEEGILDLIRTDPLLRDLPPGVTLEELNSLWALEQGRAMTVIVHRADGESYSVVVEQNSRVIGLKRAIRKHVTLKQAREGCNRSISWRYIWKTYWLYFEGTKLTEDHKLLKEYGVKNNSELTFIKRLRNK